MGAALDFSVVVDTLPALLYGCLGTIGLALAGMGVALTIGVFGVLARRSRHAALRLATLSFVEIVRNTPFLVQIFFLFFALPTLGLRLNPTVTAIIALGLNGGAYAIEIIRGGVQSIGRGQSEAGAALGLRPGQVFRLVVLKPALRAIWPSLSSQFVALTLTSSICTSVAAYELTSVAQRIESDTFRSFEIYFTITVLYLGISWLVMAGFAVLSRQFLAYPTR